MPDLNNVATKYYYIIYGSIPELMPNVAYRRVGGELMDKVFDGHWVFLVRLLHQDFYKIKLFHLLVRRVGH